MARYTRNNQLETFVAVKRQRPARRARGGGFSGDAPDKFERRHSWGYLKRRTVLAEE